MQRALEVAVILSATDRMTRVVNTATANVVSKLQKMENASRKVSERSLSVARDAGAVGLAVGAALAIPMKQAADFESRMANIGKVVDGLTDPKAMNAFSQQVLALSREIPLPIDQLQELVEAGGRMGIPRDQLIQYTREVSKMAMAFDAAPGEIGEQMGKLSTVFNIPIDQISNLGDAINFLDDNAIAKGADIIDVMRRVGGTAQQVGLAAPNVAALGSTFLTLGSSAEVSATASNALIRELAIAEQQPARFQRGLAALGMQAKDLQQNMAIDPQNTILNVLERINALPENKRIGVTTELFGKEYGDDIARLSSGISEYRRQLELLNDPKLSGSMQREFNRKLETTNAQLQILQNNAQEASIEFGTALLPMLNEIMKALRPIILDVTKWIRENQTLVAAIGKGLLVFAALSIATSGVASAIGTVAKVMEIGSMVGQVFGKSGGFLTKVLIELGQYAVIAGKYVTGGIGLVIKVFNILRLVVLANPVIAIITAIGLAVYIIYRNWDTIGPWFAKLWEGVKKIFWKLWEWLKYFFLNFTLYGLIIKHWGDITKIASRFYNAGVGIVKALWNGIKSLAMKPVEAIRDVVTKMREYLPFSPAKVGPFKDLHKVKIVQTIAQAITPAPLTRAMGSVARAAADVLAPMPAMQTAGGGGGITVNFQPNITWQGGVTEQNKTDLLAMLRQYEGELVKMVETAMDRKQRAKY